jgi:hypothetical protein
MWRQIRAVSISAVLLADTAGMASAQGSITQDPGRLTPGNLTFQNLGPAGPVPGPTENRQTIQSPPTYGRSSTSSPPIGPGTNSTGFGAGDTPRFGGNAAGAGR